MTVSVPPEDPLDTRTTRTVLAPSAENHARVDQRVRWSIPFVRAAIAPWQRITVSGVDNVPRTGPVLIVSNHVAVLDPVTIIVAARRQIHWLATRSLLQEPVLSRFMQWAAVVPRPKFVADSSSIRQLKKWADLGAAVGLFPEGMRTWNGRVQPVLPGIEKLVRLLRVPVVTARVVNAYRQAPRWAAVQRRGRVHVEFDPPRTFPRKAHLPDIRAHIEQGIQVDPERGWPVAGRKLAHGVTNVLFACPDCLGIDRLRPLGNELRCLDCGGRWRIDHEHLLQRAGGGPEQPLAAAVDRIEQAVGVDWIADRKDHASTGVVLRSGPARMLDITEDLIQPVARGQLQLTEERLRMVDRAGGRAWEVPLEELVVATVDMRRRLQFRTRTQGVEVELPEGESVVKWDRFVNAWRVRGSEPDAG